VRAIVIEPVALNPAGPCEGAAVGATVGATVGSVVGAADCVLAAGVMVG
jgi:hypothetical protein